MAAIRVLPDDVTVDSRPGETVLDALSRSGFGYRTGCTRGGCGICKVDLRQGSVSYTAATVSDQVLPPDERAAGTCLSCRAVPDGDLTIELRNERLRRLNPYLTARFESTTKKQVLRNERKRPWE
ncbi:2Fe-2S iron-sulfur cluster-binding protein [Knoellia koreensis]|uniref:2Fe-2S iron-sulfur cluster binding domain-containing protein n=1 Tax=Knoellia koreensis TaxID=2730921 RepID=A0A849HCE3_9MICO|nr:2Fe-2S iron-sulfur cluster-binding protein [Knoellia sp. DB2414S]NNM45605.1 2Fe-2S iron-sulfur cluster binding domain-containing protein [Knoellia sp. DB2414S]